jgi:hypothetical protein
VSTFRLYGPNISISAHPKAEAFKWTLTSHDWHVQPFVKDRSAFRLSGAPSVRPDSTEGICPSSKPFKTIRFRKRCQPAAITGFPPVFNNSGSFDPRLGCETCNSMLENSLQRARKRSPVRPWPGKSAHAETEDDSKIKDRLEALLCAETLQGTLSPNANPGKGSIGGFQYWMPKPPAKIQRKAQTLIHLSSTRFVIPK